MQSAQSASSAFMGSLAMTLSRRAVQSSGFWFKFAAGVSFSVMAYVAAKKAIQSVRQDENQEDPDGGILAGSMRPSPLLFTSWFEVYSLISAVEARVWIPIEGFPVESYVYNTFAANSPNEDASACSIYESVDGQLRCLFGVFDGHSSGVAAQFCQQDLFGFIERRLHMLDRAKQRYLATLTDENSRAQFEKNYQDKREVLVEYAIYSAFTDADKLFISEAILSHLQHGTALDRCVSGTCVNVTFIENGTLYVANVGDSRAILGTQGPAGEPLCVDLSVDQNTDNPAEVKRIQRQHPTDPTVVANARVKSILRPTRNIGGALLKEEIVKEFVPKHCLTEPWKPPYTTCSPEITRRVLQPGDRFVIMASDGLWDLLPSQTAVELVFEFEKARQEGREPSPEFRGDVATFLMTAAMARVPLVLDTEEALNSPHPDLEKIKYILRLPYAYKRSVYDDMTIIVIFLDPSGSPIRTSSATLTPEERKGVRFNKPSFPSIFDRVEKLKSNFTASSPTKEVAPTFASLPVPIRNAVSLVTTKTDLLDSYFQRCWQPTETKWTKNNLSTAELFIKLGLASPSTGTLSASSSSSSVAASSSSSTTSSSSSMSTSTSTPVAPVPSTSSE